MTENNPGVWTPPGQAPTEQLPTAGAAWGPGQPPPEPPQYVPPPPAPPRQSSGKGKLVAGAVALSLLSGAVGGGVVAAVDNRDDSQGTSHSAMVDEPRVNLPAGSIQAVAARVLPSVVMIKVLAADGRGGEGSGVVLNNNGMILTNNHVATGAGPNAKLQVVFSDGSTSRATLVGADKTYDVAVVKVSGKKSLKPIDIGSSKGLQVGEPVIAIGSPLGLAGTVTMGIISSLNRPVATSGDAGDLGSVIDAIQTDAAINPGNSGGALINGNGQLIGINTAIATLGGGEGSGAGQQSGSIGLGFAIPIDQAKRVADELIKFGKATFPQIGVQVKSPEELDGAQVVSVNPDSPAAKAGIPVGVIITKVDNRVIATSNGLVAAVRSHRPGDKLTLTYTDPKGENPKTVEVTPTAGEGGR